MVGTETRVGSSPLRQRGRGTLDRGTKHLGRGRNAENQRGKGGMKICMYKTIRKFKKKNPSQSPVSASDSRCAAHAASVIQHKLWQQNGTSCVEQSCLIAWPSPRRQEGKREVGFDPLLRGHLPAEQSDSPESTKTAQLGSVAGSHPFPVAAGRG